ncbi:MAG: MarR family transcriptional regulator [Clostridium sp.]|nr:MarR family transcriptional regulator [Clostridium sp.]
MNSDKKNKRYIQHMNITNRLINQRPGRMTQLASLLNRFASQPQDLGNGETITMVEGGILMYIATSPGTTNAILCEQFGRTKGAISQLTKKLETKDYILREANPADAKSSLLYPTLKGMKVIQRLNDNDLDDRNGILAQMLKLCSLEDIQTFYRMVDIYIVLLSSQISASQDLFLDTGEDEEEKP